jgi:hypothetical protein
MLSKATNSQKPEDMLLRVIRVAEILVKSQDKTEEEISVELPFSKMPGTVNQDQKTQH